MDNSLIISERYLDELIKMHSKNLVGKSCKRFEILSDLESIKLAVKELIYEEFRNFLGNVKAYNEGGKEVTQFKFNSK